MSDKQILMRVVNIREAPYDVYIGRGSVWGNPFKMYKDGDRETVIRKYEEWIRTKPNLLKLLPELRGMVLGCFCAPLPCHGNVLLRLLEELYPDE